MNQTQKRKNSFLTFMFSLFPGAGEMYLGFMKQGISLMGALFLLISLGSYFRLGILFFAIPVLWFYSFFHVHNLSGLPDEEFYAVEDTFLFLQTDLSKIGFSISNRKLRKIVAGILIVLGVYMLYRQLLDSIMWMLPEWLQMPISAFTFMLPQLVLAIAMIVVGIRLIRGKKKELYDQKPELILEEEDGANHED